MDKKKFAKSIAEGVIAYSQKNDASDVLGLVNKYLDKERRAVRASVYTPKTLTEDERVKAKKLISRLVGEDVDVVNFLVDEKLVDGLRLVYKDKMWDFSLQNQIDSIVNP